MSRIQVLLCPDSGPGVGLGHVGRLAALGEALGDRCQFAVEDRTAAEWLTSRGHVVADALTSAKIVVLDSREAVGIDEVSELQAGGSTVVLMDDVGPARMIADLVIDPPTLESWPLASGRRLSGMQHVLLRSEWRAARVNDCERVGVVLSFGGADPYGLTAPAAKVARESAENVTVILGPGSDFADPDVGHALTNPVDFSVRVARAEVLVTAFGHSVLEAVSVGTPVISVCTRDDHWRDALAIAQRYGIIRVVDARTGFDAQVLESALADALVDHVWRNQVAEIGPRLIDGDGARRVCDVLLSY